MTGGQNQPGWYHAEGDPPGSTRWWDGAQWVGEPQTQNQPAGVGGAPGPGAPPGAWAQPLDSTPPTLAEPMSRIGGRIIDGLIWTIIGVVINLPIIAVTIGDSLESASDGRDPDPEIGVGLFLITSILSTAAIVAYEVFLNVRGGTPGKRAISARIIKEDGSDLDLNAALMRMVPYIGLAFLGLVWGLITTPDGTASLVPNLLLTIAGLVMLFVDGRRQTPWDKVGKTIVVTRWSSQPH